MTFKAIHANRGVGVATFAESILAQYAVGLAAGMAVDAVLEAVFRGANAAVHGRVALVQKHVHVIAAHFSGGLDALPAFFDPDGRRRCERQSRHDQQDD